MKQLNKALIDSLAKGEIAVKNEGGTVEELAEILNTTFPKDATVVTGSYPYYRKFLDEKWWTGCNETPVPSHPISDFVKEDTETPETFWVENKRTKDRVLCNGENAFVYYAVEGEDCDKHYFTRSTTTLPGFLGEKREVINQQEFTTLGTNEEDKSIGALRYDSSGFPIYPDGPHGYDDIDPIPAPLSENNSTKVEEPVKDEWLEYMEALRNAQWEACNAAEIKILLLDDIIAKYKATR